MSTKISADFAERYAHTWGPIRVDGPSRAKGNQLASRFTTRTPRQQNGPARLLADKKEGLLVCPVRLVLTLLQISSGRYLQSVPGFNTTAAATAVIAAATATMTAAAKPG